jgi:hypothetical protein
MMDLMFGLLAALFWLAVWGMARGCAHLQSPPDRS